MTGTPESDHYKAAAQHAKKRATKKPAKKKSGKTGRLRQTPLESYPGIDLTAKERKEVAQSRDLVTEADTQAALQRPSQPTPLQKQRLAQSAITQENLRPKRAAKLEMLRDKYGNNQEPNTHQTPPETH